MSGALHELLVAIAHFDVEVGLSKLKVFDDHVGNVAKCAIGFLRDHKMAVDWDGSVVLRNQVPFVRYVTLGLPVDIESPAGDVDRPRVSIPQLDENIVGIKRSVIGHASREIHLVNGDTSALAGRAG